ncbi:signal peptidase I [Spongiactinospora sp. TRM90649]|uniref:signal peptidase I n=1 Tax=Spongiactinospora sp. TRM90649 TaxID=3031114 RepID=UPI0023F6DB9F|nr:signal peptidase I [Spongiactinospora sp. TRM90649]MDF5757771.1 signal peptidase I [Spongiactinospora sp. TRM90649]
MARRYDENSGMKNRRIGAALAVSILLPASGCGVLNRLAGQQGYTIPNEAMAPTINAGDHVTGRLTDGEYLPRAGDIITFKAPDTWTRGQAGKILISRVIGVPGVAVSCCDSANRLILNGRPLDEPYVADEFSAPSRFSPVTVPPGRLWVQGDNRGKALDSRAYRTSPGGGTIPVANVVSVIEISEK